MFKSVFSQIMLSFTIILLVCILLLTGIVAAGMFEEAQDKTLSELVIAANEVGYYLKSVRDSTAFVPTEALLLSDGFQSNLEGIADYLDASILVVRADGTVTAASDDSYEVGTQIMEETLVQSIADASQDVRNDYLKSDLDGTLPHTSLNTFVSVCNQDGTLLYLIIVSGKIITNNAFTKSMLTRMLVVALWLFAAAIVCASFISKKITDPLKKISGTAKEYAQGRFTERAPIEGPEEIQELGKAFNNMAGSLATHEEERTAFLSNVAHDLRTPMTTISGFVDGMLDGTIPQEQQEHYLQIISEEVHRLSRLVSTLLQASRLESGQNMNMKDFNLTEKARQVLIALMGKIEEKKIDIQFDCGDEDFFVTADPDAIHQVLYNLMDNAVKFTNEQGTISIHMEGLRGKKVQVAIRNTGAGIPESEIPHVFERFYKSDRSRGLDKTGTGLGLYIVKTILDKHGENIEVESQVDSYTEFRFTLSIASGKGMKNPGGEPLEAEIREE